MSARVAVCSRRTFLKLASTTLFVASSGCGFGKPDWDKIAEQMVGTLNYPERARRIGSLYLESNPEVRDLSLEQWVIRLLQTLELEPEQISEEILDSLHSRIRQQVRRDFIDENIVIVKGYMFSRTEIMLCSLAASYLPA